MGVLVCDSFLTIRDDGAVAHSKLSSMGSIWHTRNLGVEVSPEIWRLLLRLVVGTFMGMMMNWLKYSRTAGNR